jgi:hypothetical protein
MASEAPGLTHWTGWKRVASETRLFGQFLWTGVAHFWSGRDERIFYYCNVVAPSVEILKTHPLYGLWEASAFYNKTVRWSERGLLYKPLCGRKSRTVRQVEWERWPRE